MDSIMSKTSLTKPSVVDKRRFSNKDFQLQVPSINSLTPLRRIKLENFSLCYPNMSQRPRKRRDKDSRKRLLRRLKRRRPTKKTRRVKRNIQDKSQLLLNSA